MEHLFQRIDGNRQQCTEDAAAVVFAFQIQLVVLDQRIGERTVWRQGFAVQCGGNALVGRPGKIDDAAIGLRQPP